ncbi:hypothetical protein Sjap_025736 [Stephania japonica]|uniref:Uncharacterized protein n=1 Tax=Stephania japonica TaxID=461633 RepID=A0AAP0E4U5_9MAGN
MMAKLDELEREELAAENVEGDEEQHFDQSLKIQEVTAVSKVDMVSTSKDAGIRGGDEEYARMMAKLDELEREELAAENIEGNEEQHFYQSLKIQELEDSHIMHVIKEKPLHGNVALDVAKCKIVEKPTHHPELKAKGSAAMPNSSRAEFKKRDANHTMTSSHSNAT